MNRAITALLSLVLTVSVGAGRAAAQGLDRGASEPLSWINGVRSASSLAPLLPDPVLSLCAARWSAVLAATGVLSHRGADGSTVLDRYRSVGGTEAHVGEIIGAGPDLGSVEKAWAGSDEHSGLVRDPGWTHVGWGMSSAGHSDVWVVVFAEKLVKDLALVEKSGSLLVSGTFIPESAARAALYAGLDVLPPASWDGAARRFSFVVPPESIPGYFRLGFVTADGAFLLTNAFTWPPGRESPEAQDRSAGPGQSP